MEDEEKSDLKNDSEVAQIIPTLAKKKKRKEKSREKKIDASENYTTQIDGAEGLVLEENPPLKNDVIMNSMLCSVTVACKGDTLMGVNLSPDVENGLQKDLETMHNNSELGGKRSKKKKTNDSENCSINNDPKESSGLVENVALKIDMDVQNVQGDPIVGVNKEKNRRKRKHEVLVDNAVLKSYVDVENVQDDPIVGEKKNRKKKRKSNSKHDVLDDNSVHADVEENPLLVENSCTLKRDVTVEISQNGKSVREDNPPLKSNVNVESVLSGATSMVRKKKTKHNALEDCSSICNDLEEDTLLAKNPSSQVESPLLVEKYSPLKRDVTVEIFQNGKSVREDNPPLKSNVNVESVLSGATSMVRKKKAKHNALEDCSSLRNDLVEDTLFVKNPSPQVESPILVENSSPLKRDVAVEISQNGKSVREDVTTPLKSNVNVESVLIGATSMVRKKKTKHNALEDCSSVCNDLGDDTLLVKNPLPQVENGLLKDLDIMHNNPELGGKQRKQKKKKKLIDSENCDIHNDFEESSVLLENTALKFDLDGENVQDGPTAEIHKKKKKVKKMKSKHDVLDDIGVHMEDISVQDTARVADFNESTDKVKKKLIDSEKCIVHNDFEESSVLLENAALKIDLDIENVQDGPTEEIHKKKKKGKKVKSKHDVLNDIGVHMEDTSVQDTVLVADFNESTDKVKKKKIRLIDSEKCNGHNDFDESSVLLENAALKIELDVKNVQDGPTAEIHKKKKKGKKMKSKHDVLDDIGVHMEDISLQDTIRVAYFNESTDRVNIFNNTPETAASKFVELKNVLMDLNEEKNPSLPNMVPIGTDADLLINNRICPPQVVAAASPERSLSAHVRKKLLILDVNGLLADIGPAAPPDYKADFNVSGKKVFKRPFCVEFVLFCMERFDVAVWSSRKMYNVNKVLNSLLGKSKDRLLFCWDQSHCTRTGFQTLENKDKPLVLKELRKIWDCRKEYNESNTLLLDDSPYKALRNPAHTAIFPRSYCYNDSKDCSLGPGGDLRVYLEEIAACENVQEYVKKNPFGQRPITETCISWSFYGKIALVDSNQHNATLK